MAIKREDLYILLEKIPEEKLAHVAAMLKKLLDEDNEDEPSPEEKREICEAEKRMKSK